MCETQPEDSPVQVRFPLIITQMIEMFKSVNRKKAMVHSRQEDHLGILFMAHFQIIVTNFERVVA